MAQKPLTRAQLAKFLPDPESIRKFEQMIAVVDEITPDVVQQISIDANNAISQVNQAIASLSKITKILDYLVAAPGEPSKALLNGSKYNDFYARNLTVTYNGYANDFVCRSTSIATASGTTTLTLLSTPIQIFTGALSQNLVLPDATTLTNGKRFWVNNNSSGSIALKDNGGTTIYTFPAGGYGQINLITSTTSNGTWDVHPLAPSTVTWGSGITGLVFNTALTTTPMISAGASSAANPSFVPQRGSLTTGYGGDSTHLYGSIGGVAAYTATATGFNIPTGSTYQINGTQIAASNLSNGTTGSGAIALATSPTFVTPVLGAASATSVNFGGTALANYVEGTFTPGISFGGGTTGITYTAQVGAYTRIGNRVFFQARVILSSKGSSTGAALMTGLPIASANVTNQFFVGSMILNSVAATINNPMCFGRVNVTAMDLYQLTAGTAVALADTDFTNTSVITITGHYAV